MGVLSRDQILQADDIRRVEVDVPEWGGSVFVHTMTARERDRFDIDIRGIRTRGEVRAYVAAVCCRDAAGERLFTPADAAALAAKSGQALGRIFDAADDLNRLTGAAAEATEKNSEGGPSGS